MSISRSHLDNHFETIKSLLESGLSKTEIARRLTEQGVKTTRDSITRFVDRHGLSDALIGVLAVPEVTLEDDEAEIALSPGTSPEQMMAKHGFSTDDWEITSAGARGWHALANGEKTWMEHASIKLRRKTALRDLLPAQAIPEYAFPQVPYTKPQKGIETILLLADQHAPYIDWQMLEAVIRMCAEINPHGIGLLGDGMDLATISRHKTSPKWAATVQECANAYFTYLLRLRQANPKAWISTEDGNHGERLVRYILDNAPEMYGLKAACTEDVLLTTKTLLRLDEIGVLYEGDHADRYDQNETFLSDSLAAMHGNKTGKNAPLNQGRRLDYSIFHGHTHDQSFSHEVRYDRYTERILVRGDIGVSCLTDGGLGYSPKNGWVRGCVLVHIHEDGEFHWEPLTYKNGLLYSRDKRY